MENQNIGSRKNILKSLVKKQPAFLILIVAVIAMSLLYDKFLTARNISNLLRQNSMMGIATIGLTFVILTGGIDLSMPSIAAIAGIVFAKLSGFGLLPGLIAGIAIATFFGWLNGVIITKAKIAPFIVTLVMFYAVKGIVYTYTQDRTIQVIDSPAIAFISRTFIGNIPVPFIIFIVCGIICELVLKLSSFGRHILAIGGSEEAARFMGINAAKTKRLAYMLSGAFTGLGGIVLAPRLIAPQPMAGEGWDMQALSAIVVGGTLLSGGKGSFIGSIFGVMVMGVVLNAISLQTSLSSWWQWVVRGTFLFVVVVIQGIMATRAAKKK